MKYYVYVFPYDAKTKSGTGNPVEMYAGRSGEKAETVLRQVFQLCSVIKATCMIEYYTADRKSHGGIPVVNGVLE